MEYFKINGGKKLFGEISVHGAKNSALPILASTLLIKGESVIHNCPDLSDVKVTLDILASIGCKVNKENDTVIIDATNVTGSEISENTMRTMRSSIIFLSALLSRQKCASIYYPGGCEIGTRPIDLHLKALNDLGANVSVNGSSISACADFVIGTKIILPFPSVGATENIIIASAISKGKTMIVNPAREPEISDLADFLNHCGAKIYGAGESTIVIDGVSKLHPCEHTIIPDRILASTYMSLGTVCSDELTVKNIRQSHLSPIFPVFTEMGCKLYLSDNSLTLVSPKRLKRVRSIKTMPYPGFPTDSQSPIAVALALAKGTSILQETIFENRFRYVSELNRFGTDIEIKDNIAVINGVNKLHPANVHATDLRGGAALVVAALCADGESNIYCIEHIDRGYENLEKALSSIGANIKRSKNEGTTEKETGETKSIQKKQTEF